MQNKKLKKFKTECLQIKKKKRFFPKGESNQNNNFC